jgi:prepilin-type processing-associated H-X9-DG protein
MARQKQHAFALPELLVVSFFAALVFILLFVVITKQRRKFASKDYCGNNLKNIGIAASIFANDHNDQFPWEIATNAASVTDDISITFLSLSNELTTPMILTCPRDTRARATNWANFSRQNISYFINLETSQRFPQLFVLGDRNLITNGVRVGPGRVKIPNRIPPSWDISQHQNQGNVSMADGSLLQLSNARLAEQWKNMGITNDPTFLFP